MERPSNGLPDVSGSSSYTSSAAPCCRVARVSGRPRALQASNGAERERRTLIWSPLSASASAAVSTSAPRLVLTRYAPAFICASSARPMMCRVDGDETRWSETTSDRASRSGSEDASSTSVQSSRGRVVSRSARPRAVASARRRTDVVAGLLDALLGQVRRPRDELERQRARDGQERLAESTKADDAERLSPAGEQQVSVSNRHVSTPDG